MRKLSLIVLIWTALPIVAQTYQLRNDSVYSIGFWNLENFFHPGRDSLNRDSDYTPDGRQHWTRNRYYRKIKDISRSLTLIGGWQGLDIVGLCEVESDSCLQDLIRRMPGYQFIHYDSPDRRGIDCGLIYQADRVRIIDSRAIPVELDSGYYTRDLLWVSAEIAWRDTLELIVCHLPSQWGGRQVSEWKRERAKRSIQNLVDSILRGSERRTIIIMGDMNSEARNDLRGLRNISTMPEAKKWEGTHKFQGKWTMLDQFYVTEADAERVEIEVKDIDPLKEYDTRYLGYKPRRTFVGPRYHGGISDHYPILLRIKIR